MHRYIICVVFLISFNSIFGLVLPDKTSNFYLSQSSSEGADSINSIQMYENAMMQYKSDSLQAAVKLATSSLELNVNTSNVGLNAQNYLLLGRIYRKMDQSKLALKYYLNAVGIYEKQNNKKDIAVAFFELGVFFLLEDANEKALEYFNKTAQLLIEFDGELTIPDNYGLSNVTSATFIEYYNISNDFKSLCNELLVLVLQKQAKYTDAIIVYNQLLEKYVSINNQKLIAITYDKMANCYSQSGQYDKAIVKYKELYDFYKKVYLISGIASTSNNIGINYFYLKEYENAIKWFNITLGADLGMGKKELENAAALVNVGVCYQNMGDYIMGLEYFKSALEIYVEKLDTPQIARTNYIITMAYFYKDDLYNAELYCVEAIKAAEKTDDMDLLQKLYQTYSKILQSGNDPDLALEYYHKYLNVRDSIVVESRLREQTKSQKQFETEKVEKELKLSLADEEMKDLTLKQLKLEAEKREKEISLLWKEKELQESAVKQKDLERQKVLQELIVIKQQKEAIESENQINTFRQKNENQELKLKQNELEQQQRLKDMALLESENNLKELELEKNAAEHRHGQVMFIFLAIISILILGGLILSHRKNVILDKQKKEIVLKNIDLGQKNEEINSQKEYLETANRDITNKNEEITVQNELIGKKNKDITSSINYASRIQQAIMPPEEIIANSLSDYFVLFRPRDIVSGDFYWMKQVGDRVVIAAADCTGHGVPGALMSMLGISFLNEIIALEHVTEANEILNELRKRVKESLRQTGKDSDTKDGMDIALCIINSKELSLQFAGAYNSLYLIRNGELVEIKADRMPIGIYVKEKESFTNNVIQLQENDAFYIFTDGYCDQFGGERIEKFKIQPFKNLLLSVQEKTMDEQKEILRQEFDTWRGGYEQIDDVLVIGMKV